jgi:hypothetical protein
MGAESKKVMHRWCEPYFHALRRWALDSPFSPEVLDSRLAVLSSVRDLLSDPHTSADSLALTVEHPEAPLCAEIFPASGLSFYEGFDKVSRSPAYRPRGRSQHVVLLYIHQ